MDSKARAGKRDQKRAKVQDAKSSRDTKYKKQKGGAAPVKMSALGGISKAVSKKLKRRNPTAALEDDDGDDEQDMVVIRGGQAVRTGGGQPAKPPPNDEDEDEDDGPQRFSSAEKKLRALKKKLRQLQDLKQRRRSGEEMDAQQAKKLRTEQTILSEIAKFEKQLGAEPEEHEEEASEEEDEAEDEDEDEEVEAAEKQNAPLGGSKLEQRRALKRQKHQRELERKRQAAVAKKAKKA